MNKIYLPCCCVVFCCCCLPAPKADLTRFRRVIVWWVSTAKRKTRLHTDFRSARRSKRINPLKITLPTQFLRKIEEEMLKIHVSSLATQFGPQRLRYETFISRYASLATSNIASSNVNGTLSWFAQYFGRQQRFDNTLAKRPPGYPRALFVIPIKKRIDSINN